MTATVNGSARADAEGDPPPVCAAAAPVCAAFQASAGNAAGEAGGDVEAVPFLGPYIGLVCGALCALVGAFLLLAPFAFDYRQGAASVPRSSVVDLATGGGVLLIGLLTAGLFGATLVRRLRPPLPARTSPDQSPAQSGYVSVIEEPPEIFAELAQPDQPDVASDAASAAASESGSRTQSGRGPESGPEPIRIEPFKREPEPEPAREPETEQPQAPAPTPPASPTSAAAPAIDPSGALRDLLTPLVAALAADLRAREQGGDGSGTTEKD